MYLYFYKGEKVIIQRNSEDILKTIIYIYIYKTLWLLQNTKQV